MANKILLTMFLAGLSTIATPAFFAPAPFTMLVVDETGAGVPGLRVTDGDGMVRRTGAHGELIVWSSRPGPHFKIEDETDKFDTINAIVPVTVGGHATLKAHRRTFRKNETDNAETPRR